MSASQDNDCLICKAGPVLCALPVRAVVEVIRPSTIHPLPGTPDFVLGSAIVRGSALAILLVGRLLGGEVTAPARLIVVRAGRRFVGLGVDGVMGFRALGGAAAGALPPLLSGASGASISELRALDGELLAVLDSASLLPDGVASLLDGSASAA